MSKFYQVDQNNSGGSFVTSDTLCHRLFIEANSDDEAAEIAERLGCYWNGVSEGQDCDCCGDRWHPPYDSIDLEKINTKWKGYEISQWLQANVSRETAVENLKAMYPGATWIEEPILEKKYGSDRVIGRIKLDNIEQYAQVVANLYGWTKPDCRIFYLNGEVKEIYSQKL